jgi:putative molybdopterin biosynthesis protein
LPPFDRANVDGFAVRSADTLGASDSLPRTLQLNGEIIVCGHPPKLEVLPESATTIGTGGVIPRGADAVVMIEHTELREWREGPTLDVRRPARPGQFISYAGSDIARDEVVLRRKALISSREICPAFPSPQYLPFMPS